MTEHFVVDLRTGRVALVTGLTLRSLDDSAHWEVPVDLIRAASEWEVRNADLCEEHACFYRPGPGRPGQRELMKRLFGLEKERE
ncbi:hypothetical protein ACWGIB_16705 [Streptomyces xiamenensis]